MTSLGLSFDATTAKFRHYSLWGIRQFFADLGFLELETPYLLKANTPDPHIDPLFAQSSKNIKYQLHTSPEIWLKRGLALGLENIYEIARVFRDDPLGDHHRKEFTMLEWYRSKADLQDLITDCQKIFSIVNQAARKFYGPQIPSLPPFMYCTVEELFAKYAKIDLTMVLSQIDAGHSDHFIELLRKKGELLPYDSSFLECFFHVFIKYIEPSLVKNRPTVISRFPAQAAALAELCPDDHLYSNRFEIYFGGLEISNAYQECNDPHVLEARFIKENQERSRLGKPACAIDQDFLRDISKLPKTAGIALGIDRLLMASAQVCSIKNIQFGSEDHN